MSAEIEGRKLADLRVVDLRAELEKRGLDKSGTKQILLERLENALKGEDIDSESHTFPSDDKETDAPDNPQNGDEPKPSEESHSADNGAQKEDAVEVEEPENVTKPEDEDVSREEIDEIEESPDESDKKKEVTSSKEDAPASGDDVEDINDVNSKQDTEMETKKDGDENIVKTTDIANTSEEKQVSPDNSQIEDISETATPTSEEEPKSDADKAQEKESEAKKDVKTDNKDNQNNGAGDKTATKSTSATSARNLLRERFLSEQNRNLWITNISQNTRATELKQALSEHGKVVGAKVVISARHPAACCYGYVKMETVADAENCIAKLNNTELNGQIIRIEKVRPDHLYPLKQKLGSLDPAKSAAKSPASAANVPAVKVDAVKVDAAKEETKKLEAAKEAPKEEKKTEKPEAKKEGTEEKKVDAKSKPVNRSKSRDRKSNDRPRNRSGSRGNTKRSLSSKSATRGRERVRERSREMLTFDKIKDEREREKMRERERILRDRRREEAARQREIERHQRNEAIRLEREREKLRRERERLEREKAEFMNFERERQKLEREKLELERIELERAKMRMQEEERRAAKRPAPSGYREHERSYEDRKRVASDRHFDEAPPPPRFEPPSSLKPRDPSPPVKKFSTNSTPTKDYNKPRMGYEKRDSFPPKRDYDERSHPSSMARGAPPVPKYDGSSYSGRDRDIRDPRVRDATAIASVSNSKYPSTDSKISRYNERERSPHFRSVRDERDRRPIGDVKSDMRNTRDSVRYERTSTGSNWSPQKVFNTASSTPNKQWNKDSWRTDNTATTERWNAANLQRAAVVMSSSAFVTNPSITMGPSCPPPPGINNYVNDRFDYKGNISMRKY